MLMLKPSKLGDSRQENESSMTIVIMLDQTIFKRELMNVFTDRFIMSQSINKRIWVTQCKRFPKPDKTIPFGVTFPIGWS